MLFSVVRSALAPSSLLNYASFVLYFQDRLHVLANVLLGSFKLATFLDTFMPFLYSALDKWSPHNEAGIVIPLLERVSLHLDLVLVFEDRFHACTKELDLIVFD